MLLIKNNNYRNMYNWGKYKNYTMNPNMKKSMLHL